MVRPDPPDRHETDFMVLDVKVRDEGEWENARCVAYLSCLTPAGASALLRLTGFKPWIYIRIPRGLQRPRVLALQRAAREAVDGIAVGPIEWGRKFNLVGWEPACEPGGSLSTYRPIYGKIHFASGRALRRGAAALRRGKFVVCEDTVSLDHKLCCAHDLPHGGWVSAPAARPLPEAEGRMSSAQRELECAAQAVRRVGAEQPLADSVAPLVMASFDLECYSEDGGFPDPAKPGDPIIQIGVSVERFGDEGPCRRLVLCLGDTAPVEGVEILCYDTELALIDGFVELVVDDLDADILLGYNIFNFDFSYLAERALHLEAFGTLCWSTGSAPAVLRDRQLRNLRGRVRAGALALDPPGPSAAVETFLDRKDSGGRTTGRRRRGWAALLGALSGREACRRCWTRRGPGYRITRPADSSRWY